MCSSVQPPPCHVPIDNNNNGGAGLVTPHLFGMTENQYPNRVRLIDSCFIFCSECVITPTSAVALASSDIAAYLHMSGVDDHHWHGMSCGTSGWWWFSEMGFWWNDKRYETTAVVKEEEPNALARGQCSGDQYSIRQGDEDVLLRIPNATQWECPGNGVVGCRVLRITSGID